MAKDGTSLEMWCKICDHFVNESTKHCGKCNICCLDFDHHCEWVNNCVGYSNYRSFYRLIWVYLLFLTLNIGIAIWAIAECTLRGSTGLLVLTCVELAVGVITLCYTVELIRFHKCLQAKNLTTYEWVVFTRLKDSMKEEVKNGIVSEERFDEWIKTYFDKSKKVQSKTIV